MRRALLYRHQLGNRLLTTLSNLVSDLNLTDVETGYKMVRTELLRSLPLRSDDFRLEPELCIKLARRGARIFEVPIRYSGRTYQEGKKVRWRDGLRALGAIARFGLSDDLYGDDEYGSQILARLSRAPRYNAWIADEVRPFCGEQILEIGSGVGNLTRHLIPEAALHGERCEPELPRLAAPPERGPPVPVGLLLRRHRREELPHRAGGLRHGDLPERAGARAGRWRGAAQHPPRAARGRQGHRAGAAGAQQLRHAGRGARPPAALHQGEPRCARRGLWLRGRGDDSG